MTARGLGVGLALLLVPAGAVRAQDTPAFRYDPARAAVYLGESRSPAAPGAVPAELLRELAAVTDEILDGPWAPLYSDYSAAQAGGVGPAEWAFLRPGDTFLALAQAAPYMSPAQREKAAPSSGRPSGLPSLRESCTCGRGAGPAAFARRRSSRDRG